MTCILRISHKSMKNSLTLALMVPSLFFLDADKMLDSDWLRYKEALLSETEVEEVEIAEVLAYDDGELVQAGLSLSVAPFQAGTVARLPHPTPSALMEQQELS